MCPKACLHHPKRMMLSKKPRCGIIDFDSSFNHNIGLDYNFATGRSTSFGSLWCKIQIYQANKISDCTTKSDNSNFPVELSWVARAMFLWTIFRYKYAEQISPFTSLFCFRVGVFCKNQIERSCNMWVLVTFHATHTKYIGVGWVIEWSRKIYIFATIAKLITSKIMANSFW